ncbi:glycoside hydrolase family 38 C-terminal domain-containing protein [Glycomyces tenuis]|uniref:glycoside hydrolase family 38 N-terminal domain-containing protein n=1 Tax=Glycomyces tenuis TaxID=58116 RepID=UPI00068721EF|nr:glycoside hydrolase family 38 C-terminal domain-containing protein [Glycomyces tenuis]
MPKTSLIARAKGAREGLLDSSARASVPVRGGDIAVVCEPLIRRGADGGRQRALRFDLPPALVDVVGPDDIDIRDEQGSAIPAEAASGPDGTVRLLVPCYEQETPVRIRVHRGDLDAETSLVLDVPREWTIHLVHHSHLDIGYTDPQPRIRTEQRSYIDSALDLCRATDDWPHDVQFRWTVESRWVVDQWMQTRPRERVEELMRRIREGRIELSALPFNTHLDTCSTDELHEMLRPTLELRERYSVELPSAMQTDVPGQPVGLPHALQEAGVRYLSVAHNWAGRSMPHHHGGDDLPRLFRWRSPSGAEVLVWMTDSPHGAAYMEGPNVGLHQSYSEVDLLLPSYLYSLANNPYPFPPGTFGWHGDPVSDRKPYPWDVLHLRTQGHGGDNGPARLQAASIAKQWNETWEWPHLITSTGPAFFEDAEARLGDEIQTFEGDWGDWWVEGVGSAALQQSIVRDAQTRVTDAQFVSRAGRLLGIDRDDDAESQAGERQFADGCYRAISLFNEHTWGAGDSWRHSDQGWASGGLQWQWKGSRAIDAEELTREFLEKATAELADHVASDPSALQSVVVLNPQTWASSTTASFLLREAIVPMDQDIVVVDARTGERLAHTETGQTNFTFREAGRWVRVSVPDIPGLGYVRLDIRAADASGSERDAEPARIGGDDATAPVLENEYLRVEYDTVRSCIASIIDRTTGRELVNKDSVVGFDQYIYDEYTSAGGFNHQSNRTSTSTRLELLGSRGVARQSVILEAADDGVEQRLVLEFSAPGVDRAWTTLRLRRGESLLRIEHRLDKPVTRTKESAYFAFPFALSQPEVRYEITGGVTGDGLPHVPGAPQHMRAIRHWVSLDSAEDGSVAWVTRNAPLVETGVIALPYAPFPDSTSPREPGTVYSWAHNNVWDTNFPIEQAFETTFEYAVGVPGASGRTGAALAAATAASVVHPPVVVPARGGADARQVPAQGELVRLEAEEQAVQVVAVSSGKDGDVLVKLQSFSAEPTAVRLSLPGIGLSAARLTSYLENGGEELRVDDGAARVSLAPWEVKAVALRP